MELGLVTMAALGTAPALVAAEQSRTPEEAFEEEGVAGDTEARPCRCPDPSKERGRRRKDDLPWYLREMPMLDGHAKGHYLGWGVADWGIAAGFWGASIGGTALSALLALSAASPERGEGKPPVTKKDRRTVAVMAVVGGVLSLGIGGLGGWFAVKAGRNIHAYRELVENERTLRQRLIRERLELIPES